MGSSAAGSTAIATIAAMITPALLILASASLVASVLVRMARIVDRVRVLDSIAFEKSWGKLGIGKDELRTWILAHRRRAGVAETSIAVLYGAIVAFVSTCLTIALDRALGNVIAWLPIVLAILGTLLLLTGGALMVCESSLSGRQLSDEIHLALTELEKQG